MNIARLLERTAGTFPDRPAVSLGDRVWVSYGDLMNRVSRMAAAMRDSLGLRAGDRVALAMDNCPQYLEVWYAIWHAGLAAVPINAKLHLREFEYILDNSGSRICFATPGLTNSLAGLRGDLPALERVIETGSTEYSRLTAGDRTMPMHAAGPDEVAWLFYTSGTTGRPKGVMITHRNLLSATLSYFAAVDSIAPEDCILHAAPMSHGSGMYNFPHLLAGANQVIPESGHFEPEEIFRLGSTWRGLSMFAAPTMVHRLVAHARDRHPPLDGLKTIVYGGGPMYPEDIRNALCAIGPRFVQIYGQGEAPMTITVLSRRHISDRGHPRYEQRLASRWAWRSRR